MSSVRTYRKAELPVGLLGQDAPVWWAMILLVVIETTVFGTFISSYLYLRMMMPEWPPRGLPVPDLLLPIINTGVLLASSIAVLIGSAGIRKGNMRRLKWGVGIGVVMEVVFFAIKVVMATQAEFGWGDHAYGSIYWTISRLHTMHVLVAILMASVLWVMAMRGHISQERRLPVQVVNIYWQFVAVIWIPVFIVLFMVPRWS